MSESNSPFERSFPPADAPRDSAFQRQDALQPEQRILEILSSLSYRTGELRPYLQAIAQGVNELLELDWSIITLCRNGAEQILASTIDLGEEVEQSYTLHGTITSTVIESGCPLVVEDAVATPAFGEVPEGYRAYLGVPMLTPSKDVIGTICSFHRQPRTFPSEAIDLALLFAERAATAIDNYQLYQQQQQFTQTLEAEVSRRTQELEAAQIELLETNNQLEQRIERRTAELRRINEMLQAEIQERQQAEEALRQSEIRFRLLVENAADAFLLIDPQNGRILDANRSACQNLGYSLEELLTLATPDFDVRFTAEELLAFRQQLVVGVPATLESAHRRKDGTTFPVEANVCLFESGGRRLELALVRDITERKQAEQAMARLAEIGELAAMIVHEVRNPLTTVLMGLTSLQGVELPERSQRRLALALEDAERLQRLLNEILLYAKQPVLRCQELELNAFIAALLDPAQLSPPISDYALQVIAASNPVWTWGDRDKLRQVFTNLLRNACDAVDPAEPITWRVESDPNLNQVLISVRNGGAPIPPDQLARLGTPFFTTKPSGNGLGLAIVRRIVEAHAGSLRIQSAPETGTIVTIQLPLIQPGTAAPDLTAAANP